MSSSTEYNVGRYITTNEGFSHLGFSPDQVNKMSEEQRARYLNWIKEANTRVETDLLKYVDVIPLDPTSPTFSYCQAAALQWLVFKRRDFAGSQNAKQARDDYESDLKLIIEMLKKLPTTRTYPIFTDNTDATENLIIPYSQSFGFPPDILY